MCTPEQASGQEDLGIQRTDFYGTQIFDASKSEVTRQANGRQNSRGLPVGFGPRVTP